MAFKPRDYAFMPSRVLVALLHGTPEQRFHSALDNLPIPVQEHRKRVTLLARLRTFRPSVLLMPLADQRGRPTAPLIDSCRAIAPTAQILVVSADVIRSRHLLVVIRRDVEVLLEPTKEQLRSVVLEAALRAKPSLPSGQELFSEVRPSFLRRMLEIAWAATDQKVGLSLIASHLGTSTRTLEREAARQHLASPREILATVRFLRAYAIATLTEQPNRSSAALQPLNDGAPYEPDAPLPPLARAVAHQVRAVGGTME